MTQWTVVVGNIGTVFNAPDMEGAIQCYNEYVQMSKDGYGSAAGEDVTLFSGDEIHTEYTKDSNLKCSLTLLAALTARFAPFDKYDYEAYAGVEDPNAKIAYLYSHTIILGRGGIEDGPEDALSLTIHDDNDNWWVWHFNDTPDGTGQEGDPLGEPSGPLARETTPLKPWTVAKPECEEPLHYAFGEELDHFTKVTEDQAEEYSADGQMTVVVSKSGHKAYTWVIEADQWWSSEGIFQLTINHVNNLDEALRIFGAAAKAHGHSGL